MKLATFAAEGVTWTGAVLGDAVVALQPALDAACTASDQPVERLSKATGTNPAAFSTLQACEPI